MIDDHGNEFSKWMGDSRVFTPEQFQALVNQPHEERGCCCDKFCTRFAVGIEHTTLVLNREDLP